MVVTIPHFLFSFYCGFSGQTIFDDWYITFYNMIFTALPLIIRAIIDVDIYYKIHKRGNFNKVFQVIPIIKNYYPFIYEIGQKNMLFSARKFIEWICFGMFQSIAIFFIHFYAYKKITINHNGFNGDIWSFSISIFTSIIMVK